MSHLDRPRRSTNKLFFVEATHLKQLGGFQTSVVLINTIITLPLDLCASFEVFS